MHGAGTRNSGNSFGKRPKIGNVIIRSRLALVSLIERGRVDVTLLFAHLESDAVKWSVAHVSGSYRE